MTAKTTDNQLVTIVLVVLGALVILPIFFMGFGMMGFGMMGFGPMMGRVWGDGMWGGGTISGWMLIVSIVMQLLFLVGIIGAGYLIYRAVTSTDDDADPVLEEIRLAYARGDLTDEEYEQRRETLERDS